jgi:hypothetical protein
MPGVTTSGCIPQGCESGYNRDTCISMFIVELFTHIKLCK